MTTIVSISRVVFMTSVVSICVSGIGSAVMGTSNSPAYRLIPPMLRGRPFYNLQSQEKIGSFEPVVRDDNYYLMPSNWFFPGSRSNRPDEPAPLDNVDYDETAENHEDSLTWPTVDLKRVIMPALAQSARQIPKTPVMAGSQPSGLSMKPQYSFFKMMG